MKCVLCMLVLSETSFYYHAPYWSSRCKSCHNVGSKPYVRKKKGADTLSDETRASIKVRLAAKNSIRSIALAEEINYNNLYRWVRAGQI